MEALEFLDRSLSGGDGYETGADQESLAYALNALCETRLLGSILRSAVSSDRLLRDIATRSYLHPNGFLKIVLLSRGAYQLRLHVWPGGGSQADVVSGNVHNHRWDFAATILRGGYRHEEFVIAPGGDTYLSYLYDADRGKGSYSMTCRGDVELRCVFNALLPAGTSYTLSADVIHRVTCVPGQQTVSLILQGSYRKPTVDVFSPAPVATGAAIPLAALSVPELQRSLVEVLGGLDDFSPSLR